MTSLAHAALLSAALTAVLSSGCAHVRPARWSPVAAATLRGGSPSQVRFRVDRPDGSGDRDLVLVRLPTIDETTLSGTDAMTRETVRFALAEVQELELWIPEHRDETGAHVGLVVGLLVVAALAGAVAGFVALSESGLAGWGDGLSFDF